MSDKIELKPCPFCGGNDLNDAGHFVECFDCHATGPSHYPIPQGAAESWNRRHEATEPLAVLAESRGAGLTYGFHPGKNLRRVRIVLNGEDLKVFVAPTYPACEAKARAFLMGLPDKGKTK